jgi:putative sterol carrier protein
MRLLFPSDAWIKALSDKLNESESYERSAKDWEGNFIFIIEPDTRYGQTAYLYLGLHHGKSPDAAMLTHPDDKQTEYALSAPYGTWLKVLEGKLDPILGMMTRQLKLQGNLMMIMRYPKAATEIIECTKLIPTEFAG